MDQKGSFVIWRPSSWLPPLDHLAWLTQAYCYHIILWPLTLFQLMNWKAAFENIGSGRSNYPTLCAWWFYERHGISGWMWWSHVKEIKWLMSLYSVLHHAIPLNTTAEIVKWEISNRKLSTIKHNKKCHSRIEILDQTLQTGVKVRICIRPYY